MKHFIFYIDGEFQCVTSTSQRQAEKDMQAEAIAAFAKNGDAEYYCDIINEILKNRK